MNPMVAESVHHLYRSEHLVYEALESDHEGTVSFMHHRMLSDPILCASMEGFLMRLQSKKKKMQPSS